MNEPQYYTKEPVWNLKCIVFTILLSAGYWFLPRRNKWILLALLYFPYLVLAWYDYMYVCERNMGPTYLSLFYWWGKPSESKQISDYENWDPKIKNKVLKVDIVILLIGLFVFYYFLKWNPK